jgi:hypothetical protein
MVGTILQFTRLKKLKKARHANMSIVYLVKSFGPEDGYCNLKVFSNLEKAETYANDTAKDWGVKRDTDDDCGGYDEFIEVEEVDYD